ncbi:DUF2142 domain-containing protein [Tianweitania sp.]|uniref:DUF2142 domain-containing protein n=1 Tax=Tianweitania sp. TaxID=2021634 RepID=UPI0028A23523|nr:DUF2142 domain-containing protein [Tianweitania sp.]
MNNDSRLRQTFPAIIYLLVALPLVFFLSWWRQPIGVPDEWAHIARAAQLADGILFTEVASPGLPAQGSIDPSFNTLVQQIHEQRFVPLGQTMDSFRAATWSTERVLANNNAGVYFPGAYLLSIIALLAARQAGGSIVATLEWVSLANGIACVLIAAAAIQITRSGKWAFLVVASLPMSLFLFASASPDGFLISGAMLIAAIVIRIWNDQVFQTWQAVLMTIIATIIVATKIPYFPVFAAVLLCCLFYGRKGNELSLAGSKRHLLLAGCMAALIIIPVAWLIASKAGEIAVGGYKAGNSSEQIAFLIDNPASIFAIAVTTMQNFGLMHVYQIVGNLGWLDAPLPFSCYVYLIAALLAVFLLDGSRTASPAKRLALLLGVLLSVGAIYLSLYASINEVGNLDGIVGVQGRYFLPLLPFLACCMPALPVRNGWGVATIALSAVGVSGYALVATIITRYYM